MLALLLATLSAHAMTADEILAGVDQNMVFDTRSATLTMVVTKNGRAKTYKMQTFGRGTEEAAVEFLEPARDKGTKMLKKTDDLWMYLPSIEKTQKISGHMLREGMMGSDFSYEDMMEATKLRALYKATLVGEEQAAGVDCYKLELLATQDDLSYPKRISWIAKDTMLPVRQELYAVSGMLLKTWEMTDPKSYGTRKYPTHMVVDDKLQADSQTEITFDTMEFSVQLQDEVFTTNWLER